jgi:hypothetical protein
VAMISHQVLVEMLHVPAPVNAPVQLQHQRGRRRNLLRRQLAKLPVDQTGEPVLLVSSTARQPPSGSIRLETSASCGLVAMLPSSSIRPLAGAQNRTFVC